jgi:hypothetical protein
MPPKEVEFSMVGQEYAAVLHDNSERETRSAHQFPAARTKTGQNKIGHPGDCVITSAPGTIVSGRTDEFSGVS